MRPGRGQSRDVGRGHELAWVKAGERENWSTKRHADMVRRDEVAVRGRLVVEHDTHAEGLRARLLGDGEHDRDVIGNGGNAAGQRQCHLRLEVRGATGDVDRRRWNTLELRYDAC